MKNKLTYHPINTHAFNTLLSKVHLGGIIPQCVMKFNKDNVIVEALDMSNSMSLHVQEKIGKVGNNIEIGLDNLGTVNKLFTDDRNIKIHVTDKNLKIKVDKQGNINIALMNPEAIATSIIDDLTGTRPYNAIQELINGDEHVVSVTSDNAKDFKHYTGLLKNNGVMLKVNKGKVFLTSGPNETHKFSLQIGAVKDCDNTAIEVYREHFTAIIDVLSWDDADQIPEILFTDNNHALIIRQNKNNIWALSPAGS